MKTKYRTINNGHWDYLQYQVERKTWWGGTKNEWHYVWKPYYDEVSGRSACDDSLYINSLRDGNLEKFVEKYPDIEDYFNMIRPKQEALEQKSREWRKKYEEKKDTIKYL